MTTINQHIENLKRESLTIDSLESSNSLLKSLIDKTISEEQAKLLAEEKSTEINLLKQIKDNTEAAATGTRSTKIDSTVSSVNAVVTAIDEIANKIDTYNNNGAVPSNEQLANSYKRLTDVTNLIRKLSTEIRQMPTADRVQVRNDINVMLSAMTKLDASTNVMITKIAKLDPNMAKNLNKSVMDSIEAFQQLTIALADKSGAIKAPDYERMVSRLRDAEKTHEKLSKDDSVPKDKLDEFYALIQLIRKSVDSNQPIDPSDYAEMISRMQDFAKLRTKKPSDEFYAPRVEFVQKIQDFIKDLKTNKVKKDPSDKDFGKAMGNFRNSIAGVLKEKKSSNFNNTKTTAYVKSLDNLTKRMNLSDAQKAKLKEATDMITTLGIKFDDGFSGSGAGDGLQSSKGMTSSRPILPETPSKSKGGRTKKGKSVRGKGVKTQEYKPTPKLVPLSKKNMNFNDFLKENHPELQKQLLRGSLQNGNNNPEVKAALADLK